MHSYPTTSEGYNYTGVHTPTKEIMQCREHVRDAVDEAASSQLFCRACCRVLDAHTFSSRQRKNPQTRRCSKCIAQDAPLHDRDDLEQVAVFGLRAAMEAKDGASLSKRLPGTASMLREGRLAPNDAANTVSNKLMRSGPDVLGPERALSQAAAEQGGIVPIIEGFLQ